MTTYYGTSDGRDVELTVPRPLVDALMARKEMADAAYDKVTALLEEIDTIASWRVKNDIGEGRDVRWFTGSVRDHLLTMMRPTDSLGTVDVEPDRVCGECGGAGKVDELRTCFVCVGSGFAEDLAILQLVS